MKPHMTYSLSNQIGQSNGTAMTNTICYVPLAQASLTAVYSWQECSLLGPQAVTMVQNLGLTFADTKYRGVKEAQTMLSAKISCA